MRKVYGIALNLAWYMLIAGIILFAVGILFIRGAQYLNGAILIFIGVILAIASLFCTLLAYLCEDVYVIRRAIAPEAEANVNPDDAFNANQLADPHA